MKKALLFFVILSICIGCKKDNPTDPKPDKYESVTIGTQVWMVKNLNVDHYRNGDSIPEFKIDYEWLSLNTGAWCNFDNDTANGSIYGKLYNWFAVNDPRGLAPLGWHVPSDLEWEELSEYLGGYTIAGGKLKESGTSHWRSPNNGATNMTGFSALPGGIRNRSADFTGLGYNGFWWSSTGDNTLGAWYSILDYSNASMKRNNYNMELGFSVRCIKDK